MKVKPLKSIAIFPEYKERLKSSFMRWKKAIDESLKRSAGNSSKKNRNHTKKRPSFLRHSWLGLCVSCLH
jgi:hypothetical protein